MGLNINVLMPKIYAEKHDLILTRYFSSSADRFNGQERMVPALKKNGYILPIIAMTKAIPSL